MKKNNSKFYGVFYHVLIFPGVEIALILIEKLFLFKSMVEHRNVWHAFVHHFKRKALAAVQILKWHKTFKESCLCRVKGSGRPTVSEKIKSIKFGTYLFKTTERGYVCCTAGGAFTENLRNFLWNPYTFEFLNLILMNESRSTNCSAGLIAYAQSYSQSDVHIWNDSKVFETPYDLLKFSVVCILWRKTSKRLSPFVSLTCFCIGSTAKELLCVVCEVGIAVGCCRSARSCTLMSFIKTPLSCWGRQHLRPVMANTFRLRCFWISSRALFRWQSQLQFEIWLFLLKALSVRLHYKRTRWRNYTFDKK